MLSRRCRDCRAVGISCSIYSSAACRRSLRRPHSAVLARTLRDPAAAVPRQNPEPCSPLCEAKLGLAVRVASRVLSSVLAFVFSSTSVFATISEFATISRSSGRHTSWSLTLLVYMAVATGPAGDRLRNRQSRTLLCNASATCDEVCYALFANLLLRSYIEVVDIKWSVSRVERSSAVERVVGCSI